MKVSEYTLQGRVLRGGKGLRARSNKTTIYCKDQTAIEQAQLKYGDKCKYALLSQLK